MEGSNNLK
jgi:hypothetical protein